MKSNKIATAIVAQRWHTIAVANFSLLLFTLEGKVVALVRCSLECVLCRSLFCRWERCGRLCSSNGLCGRLSGNRSSRCCRHHIPCTDVIVPSAIVLAGIDVERYSHLLPFLNIILLGNCPTVSSITKSCIFQGLPVLLDTPVRCSSALIILPVNSIFFYLFMLHNYKISHKSTLFFCIVKTSP